MVRFDNISHDASTVANAEFGTGYISNMSLGFEQGTQDLRLSLDQALEVLQKIPVTLETWRHISLHYLSILFTKMRSRML